MPSAWARDPDTAAVERRHRHREALALLVQQPVAIHLGAVDRDASWSSTS